MNSQHTQALPLSSRYDLNPRLAGNHREGLDYGVPVNHKDVRWPIEEEFDQIIEFSIKEFGEVVLDIEGNELVKGLSDAKRLSINRGFDGLEDVMQKRGENRRIYNALVKLFERMKQRDKNKDDTSDDNSEGSKNGGADDRQDTCEVPDHRVGSLSEIDTQNRRLLDIKRLSDLVACLREVRIGNEVQWALLLQFLQVRWQNDGQLVAPPSKRQKMHATAALDHHVTTKFKRTFSIRCLQLSVVCQTLKRDFEIIRVHFPNDDTKLLRLKRAEQFYLVKLCCLPKEHRHNFEHDVIRLVRILPYRSGKIPPRNVVARKSSTRYLESLTKPEMLAQVFYDILQVHRWLYTHARIRYHNLDSANIALRCDGDKNTHMVSWVTRTWRLLYLSRISHHQNGALVQGRLWSKALIYRHDLESLFYIMLLYVCNHHQPGKMLDHDKLNFKSWISRSIDKEELAREKGNFLALDSDTYPFPIQPFFERFRPWLDAIRECFRFGYAKRSWAANEEEQQTLFGHVTYEKMDNIMGSFNGKLLEKRWPANGQ